jgi:hypothetical protein
MPDLTLPQVVSPSGERIVTSHKKVAEALIKMHGLHEGIWGVYLRFALGAANVGDSEEQLNPAAIVPVVEIGLQKFEKETNLSVDAAKVNPKEPRPPS